MNAVTDIAILSLSERPDDLQTVARWIWEEWGTRTLEETAGQLADPPGCPPTLLAVAGAAPVGVVGFRRFQRSGESVLSLWINSLYVPYIYRSQSIGTTLLAEATLRARNFETTIYVYTSATSFYLRRGWSLVEHNQDGELAVLKRRT